MLHPVAVYPCPFRKSPNLLVMCEAKTPQGAPAKNSFRGWCNDVHNAKLELEPWYGIEQEFFIVDCKTGKPLGFPADGSMPRPQFPVCA